ncbi:hypothetical protein Glove_368g45 [Diversispora epigaea]|uniref:Protein kinase domain-containing protein n=1 Tax=Diversispora epigaea TaxID=1348612 RepID=A0A397HA34_9GLOM|nr:hypothetical protein Glove_368g45 [Diversispora epigaea]
MFEPDDYRNCLNCGEVTYIDIKKLCQQCYTSGNKNIDNFIKHTQISGLKLCLKEYHKLKPKLQPYLYLEWVPFNNFSDIEYIAAGGFSKIFKATLNLNGQKRHIVLKVLNYSKNVDTKFLNELKLTYQLKSKFVIKCYGATQDPKTKNYAFILDYAPNGDLNHFLQFSRRVTVNLENSKKPEPQIYGVISYMAPELFRGQPYSFASDIYSLGMIMWQLTTGHKPFHDQEYGPKLILDILNGKRPEITKDTPECWEKLMKKCWPNDQQ